MKNNQIIYLTLILVSLLICFTKVSTLSPTSNWILDVKNEKGTNDTIVLKPNVLTRITFILKHEDDHYILDRSFDNAQFIIELEDDNIVFYEQEMPIIPSKSLEYSAYIGLKCENKIQEDKYDLQFKVKTIRDLDGYDKKDAELKINKITVEINNTRSLIELEPVETNLTEKGYSLLRLKKEIYNIEKVVIVNKGDQNDNFKFKEVEIEPYTKRKEYNENENSNHGILFDFPFGTESEYKDLKNQTNYTYILDMREDDKCSAWFEISEKSKEFNIIINSNPLITLNESIQEAIVYTMENITPKKDISNNIQLKMTIPISPIIIDCRLKGDGNGDNQENNEIEYKDYILEKGDYILKFDDLNSNNEYKAECKIFSLNKDKSEIEIKIGNDKDYDFVTPLIPSRTMNSIPQCLEFTFSSKNEENLEDKVKKFTDLSEKLCHKTMTKDEPILSRIMGSYKCKKTEYFEEIEKGKQNKTVLCIGASPSFESRKFRETLFNKTDSYYEDHVNEFIGLINTTEKIREIFNDEEDISDLELADFKRYYDLDSPDINKIKLEVDKTVSGKKEKDILSFKISSSNKQPIECFYNEEMKIDDTKRFINLHYYNLNRKGITLYPNEEKKFQTKLNNYKNKKIYTLYMNCYNLPGAKIRYEQTGVFNAFTYLSTEDEDGQNVIVQKEVTINCAEKNNRINPNCLKGQYNSLLNKIKTKMPKIVIDEEIEKFNKLSNKVQFEFLEELTQKFNKEIIKIEKKTSEYISKLINMERYLSNRDCSIYSSGNTSDISKTLNDKEYIKCRESKKSIQKALIKLIKDLNIKELIEDLSTNKEENIKYILLLIEELSNNYDSFNEGESNILYNIVLNLQENFTEYWSLVEEYLKEKGSLDITISAIKKDLSNILIQSLINLVKVLHFEEIDNYISEEKRNITKSGIMGYENGKKIYKSIKEFVKIFNEFGNGEYNLSDSLLINVTIKEDYKEDETNTDKLENNNENDEKIIKYEDKGIIVILHPKSMMKLKNVYTLQIVNFDSPLIPIKTRGNKNESTLDMFISITLYDKNGNEINIDDLPENYKPKILYNKIYHKYLEHCFFYNEISQDLDENGINSDDNFDYNGKKYFKCSSKHLTAFTAGNYYEPDSGNDESGIGTIGLVMIVLGSILLIIIIFVLIITLKKRSQRKIMENEEKETNVMQIMD